MRFALFVFDMSDMAFGQLKPERSVGKRSRSNSPKIVVRDRFYACSHVFALLSLVVVLRLQFLH